MNIIDVKMHPVSYPVKDPFPTLLEDATSENALRTALAKEPIRLADGIVAVTRGPGLGR